MIIRIADFIISFVGLVLFLPLFLFISFLIRIESKGPLFYKQNRIGKGGKVFVLFKFRTMLFDSDKYGLLTIGSNDVRITRCGRFLRKLKIDEFPQLFNVLKGDMSMVGPRPEVPKYVNLYSEEQRKVLLIKPGITDYASIKFMNENEILGRSLDPEKTYINEIMPNKIKLNMIFIKNKDIKLYFSVLGLTIIKILNLFPLKKERIEK